MAPPLAMVNTATPLSKSASADAPSLIATAEAWQEYLETVDRLEAAGATLAPGSAQEQQAIARFQELLSDYKAPGFPAATSEVYAEDAFFNDTRPDVYDKSVADDAWGKTLAFFGKHLG